MVEIKNKWKGKRKDDWVLIEFNPFDKEEYNKVMGEVVKLFFQ